MLDIRLKSCPNNIYIYVKFPLIKEKISIIPKLPQTNSVSSLLIANAVHEYSFLLFDIVEQ